MKYAGRHLGEQLIRYYTRSILEDIRYLHSQDIMHCDIKGGNVLVGSKLADFGSAVRMDGDAAVTDSGIFNGTPRWMAPEVARQVTQGPASDIWSFRCTVVEMATGEEPWSNIARGEIAFTVVCFIRWTEEVPDLPSCLSEQGQDFVRKCFQRDPKLRWTAAQLLEHLFITSDDFLTIQSNKATKTSLSSSPTRALEFPSSATPSSDSIVNSIPLLKPPVCTKRLRSSKQAMSSRLRKSSLNTRRAPRPAPPPPTLVSVATLLSATSQANGLTYAHLKV